MYAVFLDDKWFEKNAHVEKENSVSEQNVFFSCLENNRFLRQWARFPGRFLSFTCKTMWRITLAAVPYVDCVRAAYRHLIFHGSRPPDKSRAPSPLQPSLGVL